MNHKIRQFSFSTLFIWNLVDNQNFEPRRVIMSNEIKLNSAYFWYFSSLFIQKKNRFSVLLKLTSQNHHTQNLIDFKSCIFISCRDMNAIGVWACVFVVWNLKYFANLYRKIIYGKYAKIAEKSIRISTFPLNVQWQIYQWTKK